MIARKAAANPVHEAAGIAREPVAVSEEDAGYSLSRELRAELMDPETWHQVLETFARTMRLAVALTDPAGRLLGKCHNPQPAWLLARGARPKADGECSFCLPPPAFCSVVADALKTGKVAIVEDQAGLAHVAVPLSLQGQPLGTLIAGQVFIRYPEPLPLQRVARDVGISPQQFWHQAIQQVPVSRGTLRVYADLLMSLGQAFLGQRHAAILQRKLAQTNQRYRLFIDGVKDYAHFTMDDWGRVTSWNSGAERLFGYTEAEILGQDSACLVVPEHVHWDVIRQAMVEADRPESVEWEGWRVRKDGTRFFGAGVLVAMETGNALEYGALVHDVTEIRQAEEDLRHASKLEGIGVLAGGIAHDFNNLLTGIMAGLSVVKTSVPQDDPAYYMVEIAEQSSARAAELVAQLLAYAGKGKFVISRFDFSALIAEMMPLIAASIPKTVELDLLLTPGLPWIEADASQIRQVVMNLIINGAEAIGPEGGTVRVLTGVSASGTDIFMEVKDSGSGMSEITKSKMFDPFFTTKLMGRGLGLAAVSGIIRGHKGQMRVSSVPGQGTTFTVAFPVAQAAVLRLVNPSPVLSQSTGTILVVDDEPVLRKIAGVILEKAGFTVLVAENGREAFEVFRQNAPGIAAVLLDMTMPIMSGQDAFRLMRQIQPDVPIIMSSGYSEVSAREELGDDAVFEFLQKPYAAAKLVESIQRILQYSARQ